MATSTTRTADATRTPGPVGLLRTGLAAVVVLGPLSIAIIRGILPYATTDDSAAIVDKIAANQSTQSAVLWLSVVAMLTLVPAVIAVGLLARRSSRLLGTWGMVLGVAGFSSLAAVTAVDFTTMAAVRAGIDPATTVALLDELNAEPALTVGVAAFVLGHIVGVILLGVALLRGRVIPAWAAWALIASQPLHLVFAVIVPSNLLDALAWGVTTVGFAMAAVRLGRESTTD
jgi:hypothetical protein